MSKRYECTLSEESLRKAREELNEPAENSLRLKAIDKLRKRFEDQASDLKLIRSDDAFLLRFLRVRKYDEDRAFEALKNYHNRRVDDPKMIKDYITTGAAVPLREGRAKNGTFVLCVKPGHGYKESGDFLKFLALLILTLEKLLEEEEVQIYGLTIINDVSEVKLSYLPFMASYAKTLFHVLQDVMPVRIKSLNIVNESTIIDVAYSIMTRFMKDKLKSRLQLHGSNFETVHEKVDRKYLPFYLGGTGPDLNGNWWAEQIISSIGKGEDTAL